MITRRTALALGPAALASFGTRAQERIPIRVGYVPVIGAAPLFVMTGAGWTREAGLDLGLKKLETGPPAKQDRA